MNNPVSLSVEDPRIARLVDELASEPSPLIRDRTLTGTIYLDGRRFRNCTFRDCTLYVSLGRFDIDDCRFDGRIELIAKGPALGLIGLLKAMDWQASDRGPGSAGATDRPDGDGGEQVH